MSGETDRLGLYLAGGGSSEEFNDEVIDIDSQNTNFELIDVAVGAPEYTSVSRPATPFDSQLIWETDTKRLSRWNSGTSEWDTIADKAKQDLYDLWHGTNLPAFFAAGVSVVSKSGTQSYVALVLGDVKVNQGGHYDGTTGKFKAPVAGLYDFHAALTAATGSAGPEWSVYKNGVLLYGNMAIGYTNSYNTFSADFIADLEVNDEIQIFWQNNNNFAVTIDRTRSHFSGKYIG